jgi:cell division protein FtsN
MSDELKQIIFQVLGSWQVILITLLVIAYLSLVFYVVKFKKKVVIPKAAKTKVAKPPKPKKADAESVEEEEA